MKKDIPRSTGHASVSDFADYMGFRIGDWEEDLVRIDLDIAPKHLNRHGSVHGGVLTAMVDYACALAGCYCEVKGHIRKVVTLSITTSFTGRASSGTLNAIGRRRPAGRRIFVSTAEVLDERGNLVAIGEATCRYVRGSENPEGIPE